MKESIQIVFNEYLRKFYSKGTRGVTIPFTIYLTIIIINIHMVTIDFPSDATITYKIIGVNLLVILLVFILACLFTEILARRYSINTLECNKEDKPLLIFKQYFNLLVVTPLALLIVSKIAYESISLVMQAIIINQKGVISVYILSVVPITKYLLLSKSVWIVLIGIVLLQYFIFNIKNIKMSADESNWQITRHGRRL